TCSAHSAERPRKRNLMDEYTSRRRCPSCGTGGDYPATIKSCPLCGGSLEAESAAADDSLVELLIPFAATQCPSCGMTTFLRRNQQCAGCGADLADQARPRVGEAVRRRRDAFKVRIQRLTRHAQDSAILQPSFTRKGQEVSLTDYTDTVFEPTLSFSVNIWPCTINIWLFHRYLA